MGERYLHSIQDHFSSEQGRDPALEELVAQRIGRVADINLLQAGAVDEGWLESKTWELTDGIELPHYPVIFFENPKAAEVFARSVDRDEDWINAWSNFREQANNAIEIPGLDSYRGRLWAYARYAAQNAINLQTRKPDLSYIRTDIKRRFGAYVQWSLVEKELGFNRLEPFIDVCEAGPVLLGTAFNTFGIFTPREGIISRRD